MATTRQVALLRGINVGKNKQVPMPALRDLIESLGFEDVKTHLRSGNIVYTTDKSPATAAKKIETALEKDMSVKSAVLTRTHDDLAAIIKSNPLGDVADNPSLYLVTFLAEKPKAKPLKDLDPEDFTPEVFKHEGQEIYTWSPDGVRNAKLTYQYWEKLLGVTATARNWRTVTKLLDMTST
ncbi:DUF1697 domain-containing protein [Sphaerisporangium rubeum]|uniref:Uncharacterized protein (DUF1697 family) n=1 Tax=Sphaerisporangium rubeum TaxID=321317 RepID=A0A7X0II93_9ACTN|nr:DUF1697 domain-containing protein [Sphaerisporangium rubeum]MBB6475687.1 uncharacterized protein (DUF1697 family) [Sphaerisporangium rubeum]